MKIGTFMCWLFGHVFVGFNDGYDETHGYYRSRIRLDWCRRCGIEKVSASEQK